VKLIQDKYEQKKFLAKNGFAVADFVEISGYQQALETFGSWKKMIIKSKTDSFDGRGNIVISDESGLKLAFDKFDGKGMYAERIVPFKKELGVMVAKDTKGRTLSYPAVQTIHERNICVEVYAPADTSGQIAEEAKTIAEKAVAKFAGAGMYGVELFLDHDDNLLINEIAPRVHNSGHYTMDMFKPSQFTQHILAITGQELIEPSPLAKYCCMINILGERDGPVKLSGTEDAENIPGVSVYIYG
jgi:phosphoribosylaminoimidazole carboxylase